MEILLSVYGTGRKPLESEKRQVNDGANLLALLHELEALDMLPKRFGDSGDFQDLLIFVNHNNVSGPNGLETKLAAGDRVVVLSAMAGG